MYYYYYYYYYYTYTPIRILSKIMSHGFPPEGAGLSLSGSRPPRIG